RRYGARRDLARGVGAAAAAPAAAADLAARAVPPTGGRLRGRSSPARRARRAAQPRDVRAAGPCRSRARDVVLVSMERVAARAAARRGGGDDPGRRAARAPRPAAAEVAQEPA